MDTLIMAFLISLVVIALICLSLAIVRQIIVNKSNRNNIMTGSGNHIMETTKYSGKYSVCKSIGETDE